MIHFERQRCQPWLYKGSDCELCMEACPVEGCLSLTDDGVAVDTALCNSCGICATACPTGALGIRGLSETELLTRLLASAGNRGLHLSCSLGPARVTSAVLSDVVPVKLPCLAIVNESLLSALLLSCTGKVILDVIPCKDCSFSGALEIIKQSAEDARALTRECGLTKTNLKLFDKSDGESRGTVKRTSCKEITSKPEYSRRELFSLFRDKANGNELVSEPPASGTKELLPSRRAVLMEALEDINLSQAGELREGEFPVRSLSISKECTACNRCTVFCPTGAITAGEIIGHISIDFEPRRCMACLRCAELCIGGAIGYEDSISIKALIQGERIELIKKETVTCDRCGRTSPKEEFKNGCPTCNKRASLEGRINSMLFGKSESVNPNNQDRR